jgi:hypothetical protein
MATKEQCEYYDRCGFVKWRASGINNQALALPNDGDCEIDLSRCSRLAPHVPISIEDFGPKTTEEMETSFPLIYNDHGRPPKRIEGGANR